MKPSSICLIALTAVFIAFSACKKGGPAAPYDVALPNTSGDLVVKVLDDNSPVTNLNVQVYDPAGNTTTAKTDLYGQTSFPFDYKRIYQEQPNPQYKITFPAQGIYSLSEGLINPVNGNNIFNFSAPIGTLVPVAQGPVSYPINLQSDVIYQLNYNQGGNLQVPVTLYMTGLPAGWTANYSNLQVGETTNTASVTITIPAGSIKQPSLIFNGNTNNGILRIYSQPTTIYRGFPINVWAHFDNTPTWVNPTYNLGGSWGIGSSGAPNATWTGYFHCGIYGVNGEYYYSTTTSFTGNTGTRSWSTTGYSCASHNCTGELQYEIYFTNADIGAFYILYRTGITIKDAGSWDPTAQNF